MAETVLTEQNFETEVLKSEKPVLVDFWATWCGPCKMIAPIIEEIAKEYEGKIKVGKVNVDEQEQIAIKYRISSIPTLMLFENGNVKKTMIGYRPKTDIEEMLK